VVLLYSRTALDWREGLSLQQEAPAGNGCDAATALLPHSCALLLLLLQEFVGDKINAGIYVVNPSILDRIELRPTSIEREVFPHIAADNKLFAFTLPGYWMDVGQPKDYLKGGLGVALSRGSSNNSEGVSFHTWAGVGATPTPLALFATQGCAVCNMPGCRSAAAMRLQCTLTLCLTPQLRCACNAL
jgi:hypothetical protein